MYTSLVVAAAAALLSSSAQAQTINVTSTPATGFINYTTVTGYFLQDNPTTNASTFDYTATNFGLINRTYDATSGVNTTLTQWQKFALQVEWLNNNAPLNTVYKVIWFGRHGEGYHNAAETFYGTPAWNCYWAELNGNATANWADADLTPNGINQALVAHNFWAQEIAIQKIPFPQSYYTSPLTRCLRTANLTFSGLNLPAYYPFVPTVRELFREGISLHTCDRRSNRTYIRNRFPTYNIDASLTEYDQLWNGVTAETSAAQDARSRIALDSVFSDDDHTYISVTSHSGEIGSILRVLGHQPFSLSTGAVIPVLVRAQFVPTGLPYSMPAYTVSTHCAAPPVTSIGSLAQGCVCSGTAVGGITSRIDTIASDYPSGAGFQASTAPTATTSSSGSRASSGGASASASAAAPSTSTNRASSGSPSPSASASISLSTSTGSLASVSGSVSSSRAATTSPSTTTPPTSSGSCATICSPTNFQTWGPGGWGPGFWGERPGGW
ncbi:hypothetical protein BAUCODRAFT_38246 [Baudoinia panamericana UAMH 10762]|uniref:Phosphoglycerate mutase-like protein n=1 Tax=Baudoinia panamericana (strain UAMH 10762) TaxID=717646 RepID=M2MLF8_BAUPA|nr:uncharacterized protein BAUCODRAFT_38246 [Baudoinia panamericana UAMH 10762]EMC92228.1 hypothetical protein BAUCODRAFT_38246 [Baudoinia panamericana UAMH 10762]